MKYTDEEYEQFQLFYNMNIIKFDFWKKYNKQFSKIKKEKVINKLRKREK